MNKTAATKVLGVTANPLRETCTQLLEDGFFKAALKAPEVSGRIESVQCGEEPTATVAFEDAILLGHLCDGISALAQLKNDILGAAQQLQTHKALLSLLEALPLLKQFQAAVEEVRDICRKLELPAPTKVEMSADVTSQAVFAEVRATVKSLFSKSVDTLLECGSAILKNPDTNVIDLAEKFCVSDVTMGNTLLKTVEGAGFQSFRRHF